MELCGLRKDTSPDYFAKGVISSSHEADYARHSIQRCIDLCALTFPSRLISFIVGLCICQLEAGVDLSLHKPGKQPGETTWEVCRVPNGLQNARNMQLNISLYVLQQ